MSRREEGLWALFIAFFLTLAVFILAAQWLGLL